MNFEYTHSIQGSHPLVPGSIVTSGVSAVKELNRLWQTAADAVRC